MIVNDVVNDEVHDEDDDLTIVVLDELLASKDDVHG